MYSKKSTKAHVLVKSVVPTLQLPRLDIMTVGTQTDLSTSDHINLEVHHKQDIAAVPSPIQSIKTEDIESDINPEFHHIHQISAVPSTIQTEDIEYVNIRENMEHEIQDKIETKNIILPPLTLTNDYHISRKRKLEKLLSHRDKKLKRTQRNVKVSDITKNLFLESCDKFLPAKLCAVVKAQLSLNPLGKYEEYSKEFKLFYVDMYISSPCAYRILTKTVSLPSKMSLSNVNFSLDSHHNEQVLNILKSMATHMSSSDKECVLFLGEMRLKCCLSYNTMEDKIIGLYEVDGNQEPGVAVSAYTLMLKGIVTNWKQPIGFSLVSQKIIDKKLKAWFIKTLKILLELGYNVRAVVFDPSPEVLEFRKTLKVTYDRPFLQIGAKQIHCMFDVAYLMKIVRNSLMNYDFWFDRKIALWDDIKNLYELEKTKPSRVAYRLTNAHISPNNIQKQNVQYAIQVFSGSVAAAMKTYKSTGELPVSEGTIEFIDVMNYMFDLLNSSNIESANPFNKPFQFDIVQRCLLDKAEILLNQLKIKNKTTGRNVTHAMPFIDAFKVTITSLRQLYCGMQSRGHDYILTRRLRNDCLETLSALARQDGHKVWTPTCFQFREAFRKHFLYLLLNLCDSSNLTYEYDNLVNQYVAFTKKEAHVSTQKSLKISKLSQNKYAIEIPEENAFHSMCDNLLKRCVEKHNHECLSINNFVEYCEKLETEFKSTFIYCLGDNIGSSLFQQLRAIEFNKPCPCFPIDFLIRLFIQTRIHYLVEINNKHKSSKSKDIKTVMVGHL